MDASPKITFFTSLFRAVGLTVIIFGLWHAVLSNLLQIQLEKNIQRNLLISEKIFDILEFEKRQQKITYSQTRLNFMAALRHQNEEAALILKELNKVTPEFIAFSKVKWQDRTIWVEGDTDSDLKLITWVDKIRTSSLLTDPMIVSVNDKNQRRYFQLKIGLK